MRTVITYGTYDLLHRGHLLLLERARSLGDKLIVGVTSDQYDRTRGKLNVSQTTLERVDAVRDTGLADLVIIEEYEGQKIEDVRRYGVDVFTVGSDWEGQFDYLREWCEVVYLPRTEGVSSTEIRSAGGRLRMGLVGNAPYLTKFLRESVHVEGVDVVGVCTERLANTSSEIAGLALVTNVYAELLESVDAVFIMSHPSRHATQIEAALRTGTHVLCESPIALDASEGARLFDLSDELGVRLVDSLRTAYSPAYRHLLLLVESGAIGHVVSVDATCTSLRPVDLSDPVALESEWSSICSWGPTALLPALQLLGTSWSSKSVESLMAQGVDAFDQFSRISLTYHDAVATARVGRGVKSEGELLVSGTKGYVLVPAPWWKTDYFEVRYEDPTRNRRCFWQLDGEGIRDELTAFVRMVRDPDVEPGISRSISIATCSVIEDWQEGVDLTVLEGGD